MQEQGTLPSPFERDVNDLRQPRGGQVYSQTLLLVCLVESSTLKEIRVISQTD